MGLNKKFIRIIVISILYIVLLALPILAEVKHIASYYTIIILLILITIYRIIMDEKFEKRSYKRWKKARQRSFWINVVIEGMRSLILMVALVSISQFIGNGRTPLDIISKLSNSLLVWISLFLLVFNRIIGVVAYYENEKKYNQRSQ